MIAILRKSYVALVVLALALIAQIPHAAYVFDNVAGKLQADEWTALGYSYAIALELAVLMFVVHGKQAESYGFAFASVLVNLSYYAMHDVALWSMQALPAWLVAFMLPVAIARYSHVIAEVDDVQVQWGAVWLQVRKWMPLPVGKLTQAEELTVQLAELAIESSDDLPVEEVRTLAQSLRASGRKIAEIAQVVGKSESWVSRNTSGVMS